jgi:hypothetical protein
LTDFVVCKIWRTVESFFLLMSPVAVVTALMFFAHGDGNSPFYTTYSDAEVVRSSTADPIYVLVFDELSYQALLDESGSLDAARYPNFARLAGDSLHFTNATTNYLHTWMILPEFIDSALLMSGERSVRLYEQTSRVEKLYAYDCGSKYTCRGARHAAHTNATSVFGQVSLRALYEFLPRSIERAASRPLAAFANAAGAPIPSADAIGIHQMTKTMAATFQDDVRNTGADGSVYFFHTLLPHNPFVFDDHGEFDTDEQRSYGTDKGIPLTRERLDELWQNYLVQIEYADAFLGEFIDTLVERGLYDRATIIVTADHGLRETYPGLAKPMTVDGKVTRVPLFIKSRGLQPGQTAMDYQHIDFGPTLLDLAGVGLAAPIEGDHDRLDAGRSIFITEPRQRDKVFFADVAQKRYWKYVYDDAAGSWNLVQLFDEPIGDRTFIKK